MDLTQIEARLKRAEKVVADLERDLRELEGVVEWISKFHPIPKKTCPHCGRELQWNERRTCGWCNKDLSDLQRAD